MPASGLVRSYGWEVFFANVLAKPLALSYVALYSTSFNSLLINIIYVELVLLFLDPEL